MPKLWNQTIESHRRDVRAAILDTTAALVARHGLSSVTMTQIAEDTGIGRATLYKYFPDIDSILLAWHDRQVSHHLDRLADARDQATDPNQQLQAVLQAFALIQRERTHHHHGQPNGPDLATLLHGGDRISSAQLALTTMVEELLTQAAAADHVRDDIPPRELVGYCLHALNAASQLPSDDAAHRLVDLILAGLQPRD